MNETEYLLTTVMEEAGESIQRAAKALRFGLDNTAPGASETNEMALWRELTDLQGACEKLVEHRGKGGTSRENVDAKKARIEHFMRYSRDLGCLQSGKIAG